MMFILQYAFPKSHIQKITREISTYKESNPDRWVTDLSTGFILEQNRIDFGGVGLISDIMGRKREQATESLYLKERRYVIYSHIIRPLYTSN